MMPYSIEEINTCTKKLTFTFEKLDLGEQIKLSLLEKQKEVSLKGFRKGKAPLSMVEKFFRPQVESNALNKFIQNEFFKAIEEENLKVVGEPVIENMDYKEGNSIKFDAIIEIFPEFELNPMDHLEFTQESAFIDEQDVEDVKKRYLDSKAEMRVVEGDDVVLENGHFAVMNFQGIKENGDRPENMKGEEFQLQIGSGQFIPGFEDGMLGMKSGETKNIELSFPSEYHAPDLQDAKVTFEVKLLEIKHKVYPEFNDEMAKEFGHESVETFLSKTKENLLLQKEKSNKEKLHQQILEKLVEENQFDIPTSLVRQQEEHVKQDLEHNLKQQGFNETMISEYFEKWSEEVTKKAEFQVRTGLILDKLGKIFSIQATAEDFEKKLEETAKQSGLEIEQIRSFYTSNERTKQNVMYAIREEKTFDKILEKVKLV